MQPPFVPVDETMEIDEHFGSTELEKHEESVVSVSIDDSLGSRHGIRPVSAIKRDRRLSSRLDPALLNELDETVASVGKIYESPTLLGHVVSKCLKCKSDAHRDGHCCCLDQRVVERMHFMSDGSRVRSHSLLTSLRSTSKGDSMSVDRLQRISRWKSCERISNRKRKRRDCLEQVVASTILLLGDAKSAECRNDASGRQRESAACDVQYILQDLRQACAILTCELEASHRPPPDDTLQVRNITPQDLIVDSPSLSVDDDGSTYDNTCDDDRSDQGEECRMSWSNADEADSEYGIASFAHDSSSDFVVASDETPSVHEEEIEDAGGHVNRIGSLLGRGSLDGEEWTSFTNNPFDATSHDILGASAQGVKCHFTVVRPWKTSELGWKHFPRSTVPIRASC